MRTLAAVLVAGLTAASGASSARPRGPLLLISVNSFGQIGWFCAAGSRPGDVKFALQYKQAAGTATTHVRLLVGGNTVKAVQTDPGSVVRFPLLRPARQRLTFTSRTEPGTLTARVDVDFARPLRKPGYSACWAYMPPPATASISFKPN